MVCGGVRCGGVVVCGVVVYGVVWWCGVVWCGVVCGVELRYCESHAARAAILSTAVRWKSS